ncbi:RluA family pseudouridine synthase [Faecalicatena sp. AGMB00832]|uniref:RNA pseudouridylate synthase n=1 Tax=Faecalicatena faecalis TaxID=2726362 RepID=A0ABS6CYT1_9FIRM|nr:RluA family pseudouridine synthase [Faecalicatena faecalis]MBU3874300.1 RluA family pseudouridine synthase [Faecalicatena faecalis]
MNPDILYEDQDIIVCVKPAGIATQSSRIGTPDMVSILKNHIYRNSEKKSEPYLSVIHRLDQPVEGLLVFAKNQPAAAKLNRQLTQYGFGKYYRAMLSGTPSPKEDRLCDYLVKDGRTNSSHICTQDTPGAKKAVLHYQVLESRPPYSLVGVTLETGRHHQIRVQMAHLGCPIVGDKKYGDASQVQTADTLQLYACRLTFRHPYTGRPMDFHLDRLSSL